MRAYRTPPPSFSSISGRSRVVKAVRAEPVLDIPAGLQTQYIRKWESIPDDYVLKNFAIEEHRGERKKTTESIPLFKTLIEQLINRPFTAPPPRNRNLYDDDDDDAYDERVRNNKVDGRRITITELKNVLINFLNSEATLALFPAAKIYYLPWQNMDEEDENGYIEEKEGDFIVPKEIFLCKEDVTYETDRAVIDKIKREVYGKISRWRRAKEKY